METDEFNKVYNSLIEQIKMEKEKNKNKKSKFTKIYIGCIIIVVIIAYIYIKSILLSLLLALAVAFIFNPVILHDFICNPDKKTIKNLDKFEEIYSKYSQHDEIDMEENKKIKQKKLYEKAINIIINTINLENQLKSLEGINSSEYAEAEFTPVIQFKSELYIENKQDGMIMSFISNFLKYSSYSYHRTGVAGYNYDMGTFVKINIPYNFKEKIYIINKNTENRLNTAKTFSNIYTQNDEDSILLMKNRKKSQCKSESINNSIFNIYSSNTEYAEMFINKEIISQLEKYYEITPFKITLKYNHIYIVFEKIYLSAQLLNEKYAREELNELYSDFILAFGLANSIKNLFEQD